MGQVGRLRLISMITIKGYKQHLLKESKQENAVSLN